MKILVAFAFVLFGDLAFGVYSRACDLVWKLPSGKKSCYFFFEGWRPWYMAQIECELYGMHLIALEAEGELEVITQYLKKESKLGTEWLTGGIRLGRTNDFQWSPGNTPIISGWNEGEPNNYKNQGEDRVSLKNGGINDVTGLVSCPYICEYDY
ncbi:hypothetical protein CAPTEDRAFT_214864 [Capitella teleta]|uniref:C-type lectin domain-containing protein n=1 Tax=Capitella teleta TaxID=283909 RepID=R7UB22_CAPTE|nr:hypothetical protein CAPTEDRAFT_214864 [Capitella teleta]|eukprot:ELU00988.1 hypothetical protein CAPTEDRAFT_214864 [Capitella teleta]